LSRRSHRPRSRLTGLEENLAGLLGEDSMQKLIGIARLRRSWPDIVGAMMASRTEPIQLEPLPEGGTCLWVGVDHSIMAQQIRFLRDDIRKACFRQAGISDLHRIRSRVQPTAGIKPAAPPEPPKTVSWSQKRKLAQELACMKDRALKRAMFQARLAQLRYRDAPVID